MCKMQNASMARKHHTSSLLLYFNSVSKVAKPTNGKKIVKWLYYHHEDMNVLLYIIDDESDEPGD